MEIIKPSTILRNYNAVIDEVQEGEPIVLTKNGVGKAVLVNIDEWQRREAEIWLLTQLADAESDFGKGISLDDFEKEFHLGEFA